MNGTTGHRKSGSTPIWKLALYMLLMGITGAWILALAYPLATKAGIPPSAASRLPNAGFFAGLAVGLALGLSRSVKHVFASLLGVVLVGGVFWFFGVLMEGLLIGFGVPANLADWVSPVAFCLGAGLGLVPVFAVSYEWLDDVLVRSGIKR